MSKVSEVQEFINKNPSITISELFAHYQADQESVLIACTLLDLECDALLKNFLEKINYLPDEDLIELFSIFMEDASLVNKLIPKSVKHAFILNYDLNQETFSRLMIDSIYEQTDYLSQIKTSNIFDKDIIFFSSKNDVRIEGFLKLIKEKISNLDVTFLEEMYKDIFVLFKLSKFFDYDDKTEKEFLSFIKENKEDVLYGILLNFKAVVFNSSIKIYFDNTYLNEIALGTTNNIDYKKVLINFLSEFKKDLTEESQEISLKAVVSLQMGFTALDLGAKSLRIFIQSIADAEAELSSSIIKRNYALYKESGHSSLKKWYIDDKVQKFTKALEDSSLNMPEIPYNIFDNNYQKFILRYVSYYSMIFPQAMIPRDYEEIFLSVSDAVSNGSPIAFI